MFAFTFIFFNCNKTVESNRTCHVHIFETENNFIAIREKIEGFQI